jgi:carbon monoxide dehydrogenase subunit G
VQRQSFSIDLSGKAMGAGVNGIAEATLEVGPATSSTRLTMIGTVQTSGLLAKIADSKIESAVTGFLDEYFASVERGG